MWFVFVESKKIKEVIREERWEDERAKDVSAKLFVAD